MSRSIYNTASTDQKRVFAVRERLELLYSEMAEEYADAIKNDTAAELNQKGIALSTAENYSRAIWLYGKAIEKDPGYFSPYFNRGKCLSIQGKFEPALADFSDAIKREPTSSAAFVYRAMVHAELEQFTAALADFDLAIAHAPDSGFAHYQRAILHYRLGAYEKAVEDAMKARSLNYPVKESFVRALSIKANIPVEP